MYLYICVALKAALAKVLSFRYRNRNIYICIERERSGNFEPLIYIYIYIYIYREREGDVFFIFKVMATRIIDIRTALKAALAKVYISRKKERKREFR